jgi:hypothetical protein
MPLDKEFYCSPPPPPPPPHPHTHTETPNLLNPKRTQSKTQAKSNSWWTCAWRPTQMVSLRGNGLSYDDVVMFPISCSQWFLY